MFGDNIQYNEKTQEASICCPMCASRGKTPDTGFHLQVSVKKQVFHCYRCDWAGKLSQSGLQEIMLLAELDTTDVTIDKMAAQLAGLFKMPESEYYDIDSMSWRISQEETPIAYNYMLGRGFTPEELIKHDVRVGRSFEKDGVMVRRWLGRVIFPFYNLENRCTYLVGRSYNGNEPKYMNCINNKEYVVYGLHRVLMDEPVILCEGIISAIAAERYTGIKAVAALGKSVLNSQLSVIRSRTNKIITCLDGDVHRWTKNKLNKSLLYMGFEVEEVNMPEGPNDPDSMGPSFIEVFNQRNTIGIL